MRTFFVFRRFLHHHPSSFSCIWFDFFLIIFFPHVACLKRVYVVGCYITVCRYWRSSSVFLLLPFSFLFFLLVFRFVFCSFRWRRKKPPNIMSHTIYASYQTIQRKIQNAMFLSSSVHTLTYTLCVTDLMFLYCDRRTISKTFAQI